MKYIFKTTHFISFPIQYLDPVSPNVEINQNLPLASAHGIYCVVYKYVFKICPFVVFLI